MDILLEAFNRDKLTEQECDNFITEVKAKKSRLPTNTIREYIDKFI